MEEILDNNEKELKFRGYKFTSFSWYLFIGVLLLGVILRFNDTPGSAVCVIFGSSGFCAYCLHAVRLQRRENGLAKLFLGFNLAWFTYLAYSSIVLDYPYNYRAVIMYLIGFGVFFGFQYLLFYREYYDFIKKNK